MSKVKQARRPLTKSERHTRMVNRLWLLLSLVVALLVLYLLSIGEKTGRSFPFIFPIGGRASVLGGLQTMVERKALWDDFANSMICVAMGFGLGFVTSLPMAFLMAWYTPVRKIIEPWINFIRNIPALAYAPLIVLLLGVGRTPAVVLIWICTFMTMCITIFHGIRNIDNTLVKAARVLGANDVDIFFRITLPATVPFILTAVRLGLSAGLTTLLAAESAGAQAGLGMRIMNLKGTFETDAMLGYIIIIGIIGTLLNTLVDIIEGRLTSWQEKREEA